MKKLLLCSAIASMALAAHGQFSVGSDANSFVVKSGETFHYDGLTLTPSSDLSLTSTTLSKTDAKTITPTLNNNYISRYFSFSNTTPAFSGTVRFSYLGANLNGITESALRMYIRPGTSTWIARTDAPDQVNDYVESTLSSITLNTLTLSDASFTLPVTWLRFTAVKKDGTSVLNWSTASELNTQDFLVQHSTNNSVWMSIGALKAAGNANTQSDYAYSHQTPSAGINYYRLIQRDLDGKLSYSKVVSVQLDKSEIKLQAFPNPVLDGKLNVLLKEATLVRLFDASGKQVVSQQLNAGLQVLNVAGLQGGVYYLQAGSENIAVVIK